MKRNSQTISPEGSGQKTQRDASHRSVAMAASCVKTDAASGGRSIPWALSPKLEREVVAFVLWLTPCGQVHPGPSLKLIGWTARNLLKKISRG